MSNNITHINEAAFYDCHSLKEITIPDNVLYIGDGAFSHCEFLTSMTIPSNVSYLGYRAFSYCDSLKEVIFKGKILKEVKQMENYPFGIEDKNVIKCEKLKI